MSDEAPVRLRIVHAVRSDAFAGVERHIATLAVAQRARGHEVAVIGGASAAMPAALGAIPFQPAATVRETARAIVAWRSCDVLHVHMTAAEIAALLAVRAWRVPVVSTRHFASPRGSRLGGLARVVERRVAAEIAVSAFVAQQAGGRAVVVYPGVATAVAHAPDAAHRTVLVAQRLEPEKHTALALAAFAASGLAERGWHLDVAGEGSCRASLTRLAGRLRIGRAVRFLGHRADVPALLARAELFLAPCPGEGMGLAVLEAMAAGLPVVAARAGGHLETVGAAPGAALFTPGDAADAARHLARLAADPARARYGAALQELQRARFTMAEQARATDAVYRSVLRSAPRPAACRSVRGGVP